MFENSILYLFFGMPHAYGEVDEEGTEAAAVSHTRFGDMGRRRGEVKKTTPNGFIPSGVVQ